MKYGLWLNKSRMQYEVWGMDENILGIITTTAVENEAAWDEFCRYVYGFYRNRNEAIPYFESELPKVTK